MNGLRWAGAAMYVKKSKQAQAWDLLGTNIKNREFKIDNKGGTSLGVAKYGGWTNCWYLARQLAGWPVEL